MSVSELLMQWFKTLAVAEGTAVNIEGYIKRYLNPMFGCIPIESLTRDVIIDGFASMQVGDASKSAAWRALHQALDYAVEQKWIEDNPMANEQAPSYKKPEIRVLSEWEQSNLTDTALATANRYGTAVLLGLYAGLSVGELCALTWEDIDFAAMTIRVGHTVHRYFELRIDDVKERLVPLPEIVAENLASIKQMSGLVYPAEQNRIVEPRTMRKGFERILAQAGINREITFSMLRDTYAVKMLQSGKSMEEIAHIVGMSVKAARERYEKFKEEIN